MEPRPRHRHIDWLALGELSMGARIASNELAMGMGKGGAVGARAVCVGRVSSWVGRAWARTWPEIGNVRAFAGGPT